LQGLNIKLLAYRTLLAAKSTGGKAQVMNEYTAIHYCPTKCDQVFGPTEHTSGHFSFQSASARQGKNAKQGLPTQKCTRKFEASCATANNTPLLPFLHIDTSPQKKHEAVNKNID